MEDPGWCCSNSVGTQQVHSQSRARVSGEGPPCSHRQHRGGPPCSHRQHGGGPPPAATGSMEKGRDGLEP